MAYNQQYPGGGKPAHNYGAGPQQQGRTQYPGGGYGNNPYGGGGQGAPYSGNQQGNVYGGSVGAYGHGQQQPYGQGNMYPPQGAHGGGVPQNMPPPGVSHELWTWFQAVDQDRSGQITASELQKALMNGNWKPFNAETCRLMIGMFDHDRSGTISIQEFSALWKYITEWKACFDGFDQDRSGTINASELQNAFRTFGYNLSSQFTNICVRQFDRDKKGSINFDDFIQCCVMLHSMTESFKKKDTQRTGVIQLRYEEYLELVFENTLARMK